jgi:hypothetical protein
MTFVFSENYPNTIIRKGKLCDSIYILKAYEESSKTTHNQIEGLIK